MIDLRAKITAELDRREAQIEGLTGLSAVATLWARVITWGRDVLARHRPTVDRHGAHVGTCGWCCLVLQGRGDHTAYPCAEIRALATALGIKP